MPQRFLEAHSPLAAKIVDQSDYDGIWVSSLTHSASLGLPDNELVTLDERAQLVSQMIRVMSFESPKPILVDVDNGGKLEHIAHHMLKLRDAGAWGIVMEDKTGTKQNSLLQEAKHQLEDVDLFCEKIGLAKRCGVKVFARLESLIAQKSKHDALIRANAYIEAGADGILVHSKAKQEAPDVVEIGNELKGRTTLLAVPTTYTLPEEHPFDIVIEANHMLRASVFAMLEYVAGMDPHLVEVSDLFEIVGS